MLATSRSVDSIGVVLAAPAKAGFYRVLFHDLASRMLYGHDDLVVQFHVAVRANLSIWSLPALAASSGVFPSWRATM